MDIILRLIILLHSEKAEHKEESFPNMSDNRPVWIFSISISAGQSSCQSEWFYVQKYFASLYVEIQLGVFITPLLEERTTQADH